MSSLCPPFPSLHLITTVRALRETEGAHMAPRVDGRHG
jgi:hypothetical protein